MATWYICYYHLIAYRIYFISMYIVQIGNNWFRITITVLIDTFYVCFQFGPTIHWYLLLITATFSCVLRQILLRKTKSRFITMKEVKNECIYECITKIWAEHTFLNTMQIENIKEQITFCPISNLNLQMKNS